MRYKYVGFVWLLLLEAGGWRIWFYKGNVCNSDFIQISINIICVVWLRVVSALHRVRYRRIHHIKLHHYFIFTLHINNSSNSSSSKNSQKQHIFWCKVNLDDLSPLQKTINKHTALSRHIVLSSRSNTVMVLIFELRRFNINSML